MIRATYNWNRIIDDGLGILVLLFEFAGVNGTLGGSLEAPEQLDRRLPAPLRLQ